MAFRGVVVRSVAERLLPGFVWVISGTPDVPSVPVSFQSPSLRNTLVHEGKRNYNYDWYLGVVVNNGVDSGSVSWVHDGVAMSRKNYHLYRNAALIAYIHRRTQALAASVVNLLSDEPVHYNEWFQSLPPVKVTASRPAGLTKEERGRCVKPLNDMLYCTPNRGFGNTLKLAKREMKSCDQYRLCPWCRYEKTLDLFDDLSELLQDDREVCVTHFMSICDPMSRELSSPKSAYAEPICR